MHGTSLPHPFFNSAPGFGTGSCDSTIQFTSGTFRYVRCCCADTHHAGALSRTALSD